MKKRVLTVRELNRTTLNRQMLLRRTLHDPLTAIEQLGGLQAQIPNPPYIGLWSRLENFQLDLLTTAMFNRQIVRAPYLRSTLHLISAADHHRFRSTIQPALERGLQSFFGRKIKGLQISRLVESAQPFLAQAPRSTGELKNFLQQLEPAYDSDALAYVIRTHLPIVQVPPGGTWGSGSSASYLPATEWIGSGSGDQGIGALFRRYLAAFGPASIQDFQTWTGITNLKQSIETEKQGLISYASENGRELFDLADQTIVDSDVPAPIRFVPEYDNLLIAHADRTRVIADEDRKKVFLSAGRVLGTILIDGFVQGTWKYTRTRSNLELSIVLFADQSNSIKQECLQEGESLLRAMGSEATDLSVTIQQYLSIRLPENHKL